MQTISIKLLDPNCKPYRKYCNDAGHDLRASVHKPLVITSGGMAKVGTGVCVDIPPGYYGDIRGRSSLNMAGVICPSGTVDAGYTGEIGVVLINLGDMPYVVEPYERVAQLVIIKLPRVVYVETGELDGGTRGDKGFGSTGRV